MRRTGRPAVAAAADVAAATIWMRSDAAAYITRASNSLDGGRARRHRVTQIVASQALHRLAADLCVPVITLRCRPTEQN